jgi:hypothetical protein
MRLFMRLHVKRAGQTSKKGSGVIPKKVGPTISVSLVDPVYFVSLVRLETNFALPGNSFRLFK